MKNAKEIFEADNELMESASLYADEKLAEVLAEHKKRKIKLIKTGGIMILISIIMVFATRSWFTMSKEVEGTGANMTASDSLFEIKTSGQTGLYDSYISRVNPNFTNALQTSNSNQQITWHLTKTNISNTDGNMENLYTGEGPANLSEITKLESPDYGLSPGDYGTLKFTIVPKTNEAISLDINLDMSCFKTEYYESGSQAGYQKDVFTKIADNANNHKIIQYANSHISFYYKADENNDDVPEMHLVKNGVFSVENITGETEVTIFWAWAKNLVNIIDANVDGLEPSGSVELRDAFFLNPSSFLEDISGTETFSSITISSSVENYSGAVSEKVAYLTANANRAAYSSYKSMYNNADQTIGDEVGYIMLTTTINLKTD